MSSFIFVKYPSGIVITYEFGVFKSLKSILSSFTNIVFTLYPESGTITISLAFDPIEFTISYGVNSSPSICPPLTPVFSSSSCSFTPKVISNCFS